MRTEETKKMLANEIEGVFNTMNTYPPDSEKYDKILDRLVKLYELQIAEEKIEMDFKEKEARREMEEKHYIDEVDANAIAKRDENQLKEIEIKFKKLDLYSGIGVAIFTGVMSMCFHGYWLKKGLKFEETGTITDPMSKGIWNPIFKIFKK